MTGDFPNWFAFGVQKWVPGDECPRCLGHGQIDFKIAGFKGPPDEGYDIKLCPVCKGIGTLKPTINSSITNVTK